MKDLLATSDLSRGDLKYLLVRAGKFKSKPFQRNTLLQNESVALYFNKPSTRTRVSFETAISRLGGAAISLGPNDVQLGRGETIEDTARVLSRFVRAFVIRTFRDEDVARFAAAASIPVINALTDGHHPCQSVADLMTLAEHCGPLDKCKIAYLGDGNNVAVSLMQACVIMGTTFAIATPPGYALPAEQVAAARAVAKKNGSQLIVSEDPEEAVRDADALYTDVWLSMGDAEEQRAARQKALMPYQINERAFARAKAGAIFMHCLPAHRGEEVSAEVADGKRSVIFDQAENRLHSALAVLYALLEAKLEGAKR
ncbi:MAG TPA: ornithine carbamoyltransferase [Polyangiaceae bacterium]|jgi:ornithine carbamoyltransferase